MALTTNGWLLEKLAPQLRAAGLDRINVSVDSLDDATAGRMNGLGFKVGRVLRGIDAAAALGLPIKINTVIKRGVNDHEIPALCDYFRARGHALRFIEFMDVGQTNQWRMDQVLPSSEVLARLLAAYPLAPLSATTPGETATRWAYADGQGEIGFISSVTQAFCGDCSRLRLSTDGRLFTCLFATGGHDLRALLRQGHTDEEITAAVSHLWAKRDDRYSELRSINTEGLSRKDRKVEMSYIGGYTTSKRRCSVPSLPTRSARSPTKWRR